MSAATGTTPLLRRPYVQNLQSDRATILWTTVAPGDGKLILTRPDGGTLTVNASVRTFSSATTKLAFTFYQYQADLTGLQPASRYVYRILLNGVPLPGGTGHIQSASTGSFSFLAFGDSGENTPEQRALVQMMAAEADISFLMHTGDLAYPQGSFACYDSNYFALNAALFDHLPVFATPGNHDYMGDFAASYLASHVFPDSGVDPADTGRYYSYNWGNAHFVSLDSNLVGGGSQDRMLAWLEKDLATTRQFWKIVSLHHPAYPTGHHAGDFTCNLVRCTVNPILERYGVHLVIAGHEHGYERTVPVTAETRASGGRGTVHVITGGGGAGLHGVSCGGSTDVAVEAYHFLRVDVDAGALTLRAVAIDGAEIDRYVIRPRPVIRSSGVLSIGDYSEAMAPGSLVSIFGENLATRAEAAAGMPLPSQLGGVRIQLDGREIPLLYASPGQVNAQVPYDSPPNARLELFTENGSDSKQIELLPTAPSIVAVTVRDKVAGEGNPLSGGVPVIVYATGLGACHQTATAGTSIAAPAQTVARVEVLFGQWRIQPLFAGLAVGFTGLYQVNFMVPAGTPAGSYPFRIATADGMSRMQYLQVE